MIARRPLARPAWRSSRRPFVAVGILLALAAASFSALPHAAANARAAAKIDPKGVLKYAADLTTVGGGGFPIELDPIKMPSGTYPLSFGRWIYDTLVRVGPGGPVPGLAKSWSFPDAKTIKLKLQKGVKFQDNTPFNAQAVNASLDRNLAAANAGTSPPFFKPDFKNLDSVEAVGADVVRLHLKTPSIAAFFELLHDKESFVVSPTAVQKEGADFANHPVGAGPYQLTNWQREQSMTLTKFKGFWQKTGWKIAGIDVLQGGPAPTQVDQLLGDQVDMIAVTSRETIDAVKGKPDIAIKTTGSAAAVFLQMCISEKPFDNPDVRKAIAYALDREEINQGATGGTGLATDLPWPKDSPFYIKSLGNKYPHNLTKAKALLEKAGYGNGLEFNLALILAPIFQTPAEIIQNQLAKVGIKMNLLPVQIYRTDVYTDHKAPAAISTTIQRGFGLVYPIDPSQIPDWCHYDDLQATGAINELKSKVGSEAEQTAAWTKIEKALVREVPVIYLYFSPVGMAYNDQRVGGVKQVYPTPAEGANLETMFIKK